MGKEADSRSSEKQHVKFMQDTRSLETKPFPGGTSHNIDHTTCEIAIFSAMVNCIPCGSGATILDAGSGACWLSDWLQKLGYNTCSLDLSRDMLGIGKERLLPGSWMCEGDMAAIPLVNESVDAILCYGALHHVPDWQNAIYEFFRVLRPGGVLVLQEPGKGHNKTAESKSQMEQFGVLEQDLPAGTLVSSCRKAGFSKAIIRPISELSLGRIRIMPPYRFRPEVPFLFLRQRLRLLKATLTESLLNIVSPLHIVVAVKGKAFADSKKPEIMRARFELVECPEILEKSKETPIHIRILNTGLSLWLSDTGKSTLGQVNIGISLLDSSGKIKDLDFLRIRLSCDVRPGDRMDVFGNIPPLMDSGLVMLRFDLVSEGVYWFSDRGSKPVYHKCRVN